MSLVDKIIATITPPESDEDRAKATAEARAMAEPGDWLFQALDHHEAIRDALEACRLASQPEDRLGGLHGLALVLNGHSLAEELVLYPAMADAGGKLHAGQAYTEQTAAKMQMAELERLPPMSQDWVDKLEHIRGALLHHMYEEERHWFPALKRKADAQDHLSQRYREEYDRYVGD